MTERIATFAPYSVPGRSGAAKVLAAADQIAARTATLEAAIAEVRALLDKPRRAVEIEDEREFYGYTNGNVVYASELREILDRRGV